MWKILGIVAILSMTCWTPCAALGAAHGTAAEPPGGFDASPERDMSAGQGSAISGVQVLALTLEECVLRSFTCNVGLKKSREAAAAMATYYDDARGAFDPAFFTDLQGGESVTPSGAQLIGGFGFEEDFDQDLFNATTGFRGLLLSGADYQVDLALTRTYVDPPTSLLNPQVTNNSGVRITQPLLRNGWTTYNRAETIKAILTSRQEDLNLENTLNETIFGTVQAYWNLVYAITNLDTTRKSLELAEELLRINTRKEKEGIFTKIEVLEASSEVASRREQLITARNAVKTAEDDLKKLIFPFEDSGEWEVSLIPLTEAEVGEFVEEDFDSLVLDAMKNRADYRSLEADRKRLEVELMQAENQKMPKLDLTGSYRLNSIGSNFGNSFDSLDNMDYTSFTVALSLEVPIGNRTARSVERRAIIELRRAAAAMAEKRIDIAYEIRESLREIALQKEKLNATEESKRLAEERYEGELKRLKAGRSITYLVREAERNYFLESVKVNRALLDYQIAVAGLDRARGKTLVNYGFKPEPSLQEDWIYGNL